MQISGRRVGYFFLFALWFSGTSSAEDQAPLLTLFSQTDRPVKVVCFGDSVTGVYYHTGGRRAYTDMVTIGLQRAFPKTEVEAINAGISGNTTADGLKRIETDVLAHRPDLVTVMFSLNDLARGGTLSNFQANLLKIVDQCHGAGAAVLLCTPNSVFDTPERPIAKLEHYVSAIRQFGKQHDLPVADCYAAFETLRKQDEWKWSMLMSDEIHPNMGGHKLIAETIVQAISQRAISLADVPPPQPAVPLTLERLKAEQPVRILAMPPYDTIVAKAIRRTVPTAQLDITSWTVDGATLAEIEASANSIRKAKYHLVVVAVPWESSPRRVPNELRHFSWVLNKSLSFGRQEWDCITITPAVVRAPTMPAERLVNSIARDFMLNQDLSVIDRIDQQSNPTAEEILTGWWTLQWHRSGK